MGKRIQKLSSKKSDNITKKSDIKNKVSNLNDNTKDNTTTPKKKDNQILKAKTTKISASIEKTTPSKNKKHKKSLYNRVQSAVWYIYNERGIKVSFRDASKSISRVYSELKKLPLEQQKFDNSLQFNGLVGGLIDYLNQPLLGLPDRVWWFNFSREFDSILKVLPTLKLKLILPQNGESIESLALETTAEQLFFDFRASNLFSNLNKGQKYRKSEFIPFFQLLERDGNLSATYQLIMDSSLIGSITNDKEVVNPVVPDSTTSVGASENDVKVAEENTRQEQIKLDTEKEKTKQKVMDMFISGLITKDEMFKLLG
jgi:hypothetical protein